MSHTSFPEAWQERRLHHTVIERLGDAVVIPQGLVVDVHQRALQLPDLNTTDEKHTTLHHRDHRPASIIWKELCCIGEQKQYSRRIK